MTTTTTLEGLVSYAHGTASDEVADLLDQLCREDLTAGEMIAIAVILRGAFDRKQALSSRPRTSDRCGHVSGTGLNLKLFPGPPFAPLMAGQGRAGSYSRIMGHAPLAKDTRDGSQHGYLRRQILSIHKVASPSADAQVSAVRSSTVGHAAQKFGAALCASRCPGRLSDNRRWRILTAVRWSVREGSLAAPTGFASDRSPRPATLIPTVAGRSLL
jgi:hypothetical protein